ARYGADMSAANAAYAFLVVSPIAKGRIASIDDRRTKGLQGVLDVVTYREVGDAVAAVPYFSKGGYVSSTIRPLASSTILHAGQIVAIILADSYEIARHGARLLDVRYEEERPAASFDSAGAETVKAKRASPEHEDPEVGDADAAFATAEVKIDAHYSTP